MKRQALFDYHQSQSTSEYITFLSSYSRTARLIDSIEQSTMHCVVRSRYLPNLDRISILAATILLAYTLARQVNLPSQQVELQLPGFFFQISINIETFTALLVAGLTASGVDWLLRQHPRLGKTSTLEHWLVPALTAWVIGLPLFDLPMNLTWWLGIGLGGGLLMLVVLAEFIVVDPEDNRQPLAAAALTAVSFALFLALLVALRFEELRLFQFIPAVTLGSWLVSLRSIRLQTNRWAFVESAIIALLISQAAAALHYWPISPVSFGLVMLGPAYSLIRLTSELLEGKPLRQSILEPIIVLVFFWIAAFWLR